MANGHVTVTCPKCNERDLDFHYDVAPPELDVGYYGGLTEAGQIDPCECGFKASRDEAFEIVQFELEEISHWEREADDHGDYLYQRMKEEGY